MVFTTKYTKTKDSKKPPLAQNFAQGGKVDLLVDPETGENKQITDTFEPDETDAYTNKPVKPPK